MENLLQEQKEALEVAIPFCKRVSLALEHIISEYQGDKQPDTDEYAKDLLNSINWVFEVYNGTRDLINKDEIVVDENKVNTYVIQLNEANKSSEDVAKAKAFAGIKAFVDAFCKRAEAAILI